MNDSNQSKNNRKLQRNIKSIAIITDTRNETHANHRKWQIVWCAWRAFAAITHSANHMTNAQTESNQLTKMIDPSGKYDIIILNANTHAQWEMCMTRAAKHTTADHTNKQNPHLGGGHNYSSIRHKYTS